MLHRYFLILLLCCCTTPLLHAQNTDSTKRAMQQTNLFDTTHQVKPKPEPVIITPNTPIKNTDSAKGTSFMKKKLHDPNKATIRSAIIPGWGQAYNREYWKVPIVWGALAIPVATFIFNNKYYKKTKFAYSAVYQATYGNGTAADSVNYFKIDPDVMYNGTTPYTLSVYASSRNYYRQNRDYSVLWFLILWGVNVVDATVFGHLKNFDISDDLSMHVKPSFTTESNRPNIGLLFSLKKPEHKLKPLPEF